MDDKAGVVAMLLAFEKLLAEGFKPTSTILLALGHDEEVGGAAGAARIAAYLRERNIRPAWLLDEGMPITHGIIGVVTRPVAMIGVAEKGYLTLELTSLGDGGQTSAPPATTAVDKLAHALSTLHQRGLEPRIDGAVSAMFDRLTPHMHFLPRLMFTNRWLFEPLLIGQLEAKTSTNAMIRTTSAATMLSGSPKENILPTRAWARINYRLLPGDRIDDVITRVKEITDPAQIAVIVIGKPTEASSVSSTESAGFRTIENTIADVFPVTLTAPALFIAMSDTRHYADLAGDVYRFRPIHVGPDDVKRFHGVNERLSVENFQQMVTFYYRLMVNAAQTDMSQTDSTAD
jgi:carboxypeptidase PM20D1